MAGPGQHPCYRCEPAVLDTDPEGMELDTVASTFSKNGEQVYFVDGYSALEMARRRAGKTGGRVFVNSVSPNVRRPHMATPVEYAVAKGDVYTLRPPDELHETVYRAYWRPL